MIPGTMMWHGPGLRSVQRWEWLSLLALLGLQFAVAVSLVLDRLPFGHDESVYALRARDYAEGRATLGYFKDYRAPGLPWLISLTHPFVGSSDIAARMVVVMSSIGLVVVAWALARLLFGRAEAIAAAALMITAGGFVLYGSLVSVDPPGAALALLAVTLFVYGIQQRAVQSWLFWTVPPVVLCATVIRFGSPTVVLSGMAGFSIVALPKLFSTGGWRAVVRLALLAALTGGAAAVVLLTKLVGAQDAAPLIAQQGFGRRKGLTATTGWRYFRQVLWPNGDPIEFSGRTWFVVVVVGGVFAFVALWRVPAWRGPLGAILLGALGTTGLTIVGVGLIVPQYLVLPLPFWSIAAACGLCWLARSLVSIAPTAARYVQMMLVGAAVVLTGQLLIEAKDQAVSALQARSTFEELRAASFAVGAELENCVVVTSYAPQAGWYTGCSVAHFSYAGTSSPQEVLDRLETVFGSHVAAGTPMDEIVVLLTPNGKRQPPIETLERLEPIWSEVLVEVGPADGTKLRYIEVRRVDTCAVDGTCVLDDE